MDTVKKETGSTADSTGSFSSDQLNAALRAVYDLFEYYPYLLLSDTGKGAIDGKLYGDKITIGIEKRYLTKDVRDAIKTPPETKDVYCSLIWYFTLKLFISVLY